MAAKAFPQPARRIAIGIKRVSLLKQVGNYSFDGQGNKFALLAEKYDCEIPPELQIEDKGYSGTDFNRPSIKLAKAQIRAGIANAVAFPWLDRFARDVEGGLALIREFRELDAQVLLGDLGWYRDEGSFRFQMNIHLSVAQYQRDDIADKSRWGVLAKLAKGLAHYGAPYGWHMVTAREIAARAMNAGQPVPSGKPQNFYERVLEELDVVRLAGELALAGGREGSLRGICRELAARGIPSPSGKPEWNPRHLCYIVHDETYSTGIWHYGKRQYMKPQKMRDPEAERHSVKTSFQMRERDQWSGSLALPGGGIWTTDEHAAIMEAVERNGRASVGKPAKPAAEGGRQALLSNLCVCGATVIEGEKKGEPCGYAMAPWQGSRVRLDGTRYMGYRCTHRDRVYNHHLCDAHSIAADLLEPAIWQGTKEAVCDELDELITRHYGALSTRADEAMLGKLREERKRKDAKRREAMRLQIEADDDADKAEYAGMVAKYKTELALLDRRIAATSTETESERFDTKTIQREARTAFQTEDPAEQRAILLDWVKQVRYAHGEATITICVRMSVNCKRGEHDVSNKHILLTKTVRVAA